MLKYKCLFSVIVLSVLGSPQSMATTIQKCQDASGQWHYGTYADQACGQSEIISLSPDGVVIGRDAPPLTESELEEQNLIEQRAAEEIERKKAQQARDENIMQIYGSESMVISTRDRKLSAIQDNLDVTRRLKVGIESDLEELKSRKQTDKVRKLIKEREQTIESYNAIIDKALIEITNLKKEYDQILKDLREALTRAGS